MYPKSTSSTSQYDPNPAAAKSQYESEAFSDFSKSNLHITGSEGSVYDYVEIGMPYLILYENINKSSGNAVYLEFSEQNRISTQSAYSDFISTTSDKLHSHDLYELTYVMSGSLKLKIEDEEIIYNAGDCCVCNKNIHHKELPGEHAEFVLLLMKEDFIRTVLHDNYYYDEMGNSHSLGTFFYRLFSNNDKNPFFDAKEYIDFRRCEGSGSEDTLDIINKMIFEISGSRSGKSHMMKALLCQFIEYLESPQLYRLTRHTAKLNVSEQVILDITYAYTNMSHIMSRTEIESLTGYHGDHVERIIKTYTGKTLSEFGREIILKKAADMLAASKFSISEICERLGYSNRYYFNTIFKNEYGCLPSEYRKLYSAGNN